MKSVIVGTAGHIDHGKTALVRALTGIDTDRLEEEKRRGITIDLGFAHLALKAPGGEDLRLGFVDVPGHERFVRNMLAGVGGIDIVLLIVAADEGVMPQTREHFDICRMLGVERGITVLTKSDLVDADTLEVVRMEVEEFVRGSFLDGARAPIVPVSAITGAGLDEFRRELARIAEGTPGKSTAGAVRLPIDRAFTMKGFGTVVTGTLLTGKIRKEDELELLPAGRTVRVRGVQVRGRAADEATAGQRTALNLAGVELEDLARGMMLVAPHGYRSTRRADVSLTLLPNAKPLRNHARAHPHTHTAETIAEVVLPRIGAEPEPLQPGATALVRLRFAEPLPIVPGDRLIVRQFSPVITIGGGAVVDAAPVSRRFDERAQQWLRSVANASLADVAVARVSRRGA
ncbi:MAG TPA: selenocysteine-specific translation elongation factor, partial [Clostridia bacterium]|nr:selenocysteine-specific translation elongation factor [Clostridia bacterium]